MGQSMQCSRPACTSPISLPAFSEKMAFLAAGQLFALLSIYQLPSPVQSTVLKGGQIERDETSGQPVLFLGHGGENRCHIGRTRNTLCKLTESTPKMKKKTGGGQMALSQGDCQWLIFTGRNYKGMSQKLSMLEPIKLGRVRSVKLLCPKLRSEFARAGSSGVSLLTGLAIVLVAACLTSLGIGWRRLRRRKSFEEGREEAEELHNCEELRKEEEFHNGEELHNCEELEREGGLCKD